MQIFEPPPRVPAPSAARRLRLPAVRLPAVRPPALLRRPLAWVIAAEVMVTAAFVVAALHLIVSSMPAAPAAAALGGPALLPGAAPAPSASPADISQLLPGAGAPAARGRPGLGQSSGFLGGLLSGLNQDQASFEHQQWAALQALSGAIRSYIEGVVLPAVEKAAHAGAAPRSP